jgi:branched-subunit amino acid transport protein
MLLTAKLDELMLLTAKLELLLPPPLTSALVYVPFTLLSHVWFERVSVFSDNEKLPLAVPKLDSLKVMVEPETEKVPEYWVTFLTL